jgi:hypothetical protein
MRKLISVTNSVSILQNFTALTRELESRDNNICAATEKNLFMISSYNPTELEIIALSLINIIY